MAVRIIFRKIFWKTPEQQQQPVCVLLLLDNADTCVRVCVCFVVG